jgi:CheY-like chemotaxis protein
MSRPKRFLVVDDDRDSALSLEQLLTLCGHEVHTAFDGLEAVELAARHHPDVILLDLSLPKLSGLEAARRIREQNTRPPPVIIAVTGWDQDEDRRVAKEAGFDSHRSRAL